MPDFLKPYLSRIIAGIVASFVGFLAAKNINLDGDTIQQMIATLTGIATAIFGVLYAIIHKVLDKHINPTDAAAQANIAHGHEIKDEADVVKASMQARR